MERLFKMQDKIYLVLNSQMKPLAGYIVSIREYRDNVFRYDVDINADPGEPWKENGSLGHIRLNVPESALTGPGVYMHDENGRLIWPLE